VVPLSPAADDLLVDLNDDQRRAVLAQAGPVLITAGPGSGKTRTVTRRIAYGVHAGTIDARRAMALTFTTRAAGELHRRLAELGAGAVAARTFHSAAWRQLRHFWPSVIGGALPTLIADRTALLNEAARREGGEPPAVAVLRTELDWMKARGIDSADYAAAAAGRDLGGIPPERVAAILARYEAVKAERAAIDFDDVLLLTIGLLDSRTDAREQVRRQYHWFTVDEYQDVSPLQQRLLDLWLGERGQICAVGDPAQAIYAFAGADPGLIASFPRRYRGTTTVNLPVTYRCPPRIVAAANAMGRGIPGATPLRSADATVAGSLQILSFPNDAAEAAGVADEAAALVAAGHNPAEIAVLYRVHHQANRIRAALRSRDVGYSMRGSERFFDRPEVREAIVRLRGRVREAPGDSAAAAWADVAAAMGHDPQPPEGDSARDRWESLAALAARAAPDLPGADWLADLDRRAADGDAPPPAGVSLLTMHAAKGLEWDTVFLIGAADGTLPLAAAGPDQQQEERRLAYVAMTRPRRRLMITWAARAADGTGRRISPYLAGLTGAVTGTLTAAKPAAVAPRSGPRPQREEEQPGRMLPPARCRVCGRALVTGAERVLGRCQGCPGDAADRTLERLNRWRDQRSRLLGAPPYAVVTTATLTAIAEQRPATMTDLAAIPGMTEGRVRHYGADLLALVAAEAQPSPDGYS
jgi:DNA helicase-2/ATP-dependent DNA helicase PcrA